MIIEYDDTDHKYVVMALEDFSKMLYSRRHPLHLTIKRLIKIFEEGGK